MPRAKPYPDGDEGEDEDEDEASTAIAGWEEEASTTIDHGQLALESNVVVGKPARAANAMCSAVMSE